MFYIYISSLGYELSLSFQSQLSKMIYEDVSGIKQMFLKKIVHRHEKLYFILIAYSNSDGVGDVWKGA